MRRKTSNLFVALALGRIMPKKISRRSVLLSVASVAVGATTALLGMRAAATLNKIVDETSHSINGQLDLTAPDGYEYQGKTATPSQRHQVKSLESLSSSEPINPELMLTSTPKPRISVPTVLLHADWAEPVSKKFIEHEVKVITLHHEGVFFDGTGQSAISYLRKVQHWSMTDRKWADIPYHFIIGLEGEIFEGRPLWARGDSNTSYDTNGHALIAVLGDYNIQKPNQQQLESVSHLMAWIAQEYNIAPSKIGGHRDYIPVDSKGRHVDHGVIITCPGNNLYSYLKNFYFHEQVASQLGLAFDKSTFQFPK